MKLEEKWHCLLLFLNQDSVKVEKRGTLWRGQLRRIDHLVNVYKEKSLLAI